MLLRVDPTVAPRTAASCRVPYLYFEHERHYYRVLTLYSSNLNPTITQHRISYPSLTGTTFIGLSWLYGGQYSVYPPKGPRSKESHAVHSVLVYTLYCTI